MIHISAVIPTLNVAKNIRHVLPAMPTRAGQAANPFPG
jgi:hypothetical protein